MTRREKLEERANEFLAGGKRFTAIELGGLLAEVEREVWEKNEKVSRNTAFLMGNDKWRERNILLEYADWCRQQKEGL